MTDSKGAKYRVGMIGVGIQGLVHARSYMHNPHTQIVAAADTDPENLSLFTESFGVPGYSSYEEMLHKEQIDIAAPVLPVRENAKAIVAAARAGVKAIFCEKPLTASLEEADRTVEECRSRGVYFYGGHTYRNYPQLWQAREMIEAGEIGEVQSINLYDDNGQGGCHWMSVVRMFAGDSNVDWVVGWVAGDPFSDFEGDEYTEREGDIGVKKIGGYIRFDNGIECFSQYRTTKVGIEVFCSRGVFVYDGAAFRMWKAKHGAKGTYMADLQEIEELFPDTKTYDQGDLFSDTRRFDGEGWAIPENRLNDTMQRVVDSLETGVEPRCSGDDLRKSLEICIALRESHRRGHTQVKLPLEDRSLKLMPETARWMNKKDLLEPPLWAQTDATSQQWYAETMARHRKPM